MCGGNGVIWVEVHPGAYNLEKCECDQCQNVNLRKKSIEETFKDWNDYIYKEQKRLKGAV